MGWASGSELVSRVIRVLTEHVGDDDLREAIYADLIPIFEDHDCDTLDECLNEDEAFDKAYRTIYDDEEVELANVFDDDA